MPAIATAPTTFTLSNNSEWIDFEPLGSKVLVSVRERAEPKYVTRADGTFVTKRLDMTLAKARAFYAAKVKAGFRKVV